MRHLIFTALAGLLVSCTQNSDTTSPSNRTPEVAIPTAEIIHVERSGNPEGRTIVLIPGLASSATVWDETLDRFNEDYDIRTVQVAGFAGAAPVKIKDGITNSITEHLTEYLSRFPGKNTVVVGHSMGGFIAMNAALDEPGLIDEIVIVDSLPYLAGMFMPGVTPEQAKIQAPIMAERMKLMPRDAFDRQQAMSLQRLTKNKTFLPVLKTWAKSSDQQMVAQTMGELLATDLRPLMAKLTQPVSVLVPYDATMGIPKDNIVRLYTEQYMLAPEAEIHVIEDSYHFIMKDKPTRFHEKLAAAIAD